MIMRNNQTVVFQFVFSLAIVAMILMSFGLNAAARLVPIFVLMLTLGLLLANCIFEFVRSSKKPFSGSVIQSSLPAFSEDVRTLISILLLPFLVVSVGFAAGVILYALFYIRYRARYCWLKSLVASVGLGGLVSGVSYFFLGAGALRGWLIAF